MVEGMAENTNNKSESQMMQDELEPLPYPETVIYTDKDRVWCTGETNDHPRVYYTVPDEGFVVCGYCDIKFMRRKNEES